MRLHGWEYNVTKNCYRWEGKDEFSQCIPKKLVMFAQKAEMEPNRQKARLNKLTGIRFYWQWWDMS